MNKNFERYYEKCLFIRLFEQTLLKLFDLGLLKGTTHTSIGQELIAVCLLDKINKNDAVIVKLLDINNITGGKGSNTISYVKNFPSSSRESINPGYIYTCANIDRRPQPRRFYM